MTADDPRVCPYCLGTAELIQILHQPSEWDADGGVIVIDPAEAEHVEWLLRCDSGCDDTAINAVLVADGRRVA
jgi:hypothetical protein